MTVSKYLDSFIVHTEVSRKELCATFRIDYNKTNVCWHGVFVPNSGYSYIGGGNNCNIKILQFGLHSYYKGTDLLVEAVNLLGKEYRDKIELELIGQVSARYKEEIDRKDTFNMANWTPYFLEETVLHTRIQQADIIVLPYRAISQSGVLLLSIYFEKLVICADLPSFVETLSVDIDDAIAKSFFFKTNDAESLKHRIQEYINQDLPEMEMRKHLSCLLYTSDAADE